MEKPTIAFVFKLFSTGRPRKLKDRKDTGKRDFFILVAVSGCILLLIIVIALFLFHKLVKIKTNGRESSYENCPQRVEAVANDYQDFKSCTRL